MVSDWNCVAGKNLVDNLDENILVQEEIDERVRCQTNKFIAIAY